MNKEQFWSIVDDVHNTTEPRNQTKVRAALENRLRMLPLKELMEWHQIFEFYWTAAYRNDLWAAATAIWTEYRTHENKTILELPDFSLFGVSAPLRGAAIAPNLKSKIMEDFSI